MTETMPDHAPRAQLVRFGDLPHQALALPVAESILRYFAEHDRRKFAQALGAAMLPEPAGPASATPQPAPDSALSESDGLASAPAGTRWQRRGDRG